MKYQVLMAAGLLSSALSAQAAETVVLNGFSFDPFAGPLAPVVDNATNFLTTIDVDASLPLPPPAGQYLGAGRMSGLLNGNSFDTYCVQINVFVGFGTTYTDYSIFNGAAGFGDRAADLAKLITWASAAGQPTNAADSSALQAAVWEIVHETTAGPYSFTAGKLKTASNSAATQAALTNIENNWATIASTVPMYTVSRLDGATQDLLIYAPVPEAGTWAMMALGLMGVGAAARKRRQA